MKKILTLTILLLTLTLVACSNPFRSNARALISSIEAQTQEVKFRVEVKDPDTELDDRLFNITVLGPNDFKSTLEKQAIAKDQVKTFEFKELARETEFHIVVTGTLDGKEFELFRTTTPFKTLKMGDVEADPISINTVEEFKAMNSKKHYKLTADLDFEDASLTPLFTSGTPFNGSFDGSEFTLKNINIVESGDVYKSYLSIFGYASKAKIKNIKLDNVHINNEERPYSGIHYVGLLVSKVSNNDFQVENIEINNSSIIIKHNINQTTTNRNLYVGLIGGSIQGKVSNVVIKNSNITVNQNGLSGTYSGSDAATSGTYVGGVAGLIEQDKGFGISKLAFMDSTINVNLSQDKQGKGSGVLYVGGIFGAYRSDRLISELTSNSNITINYVKHEETESDKLDVIYVAGLLGNQAKSNGNEFFFDGAINLVLSDPIARIYASLLSAHATKSITKALSGGSLVIVTETGNQNSIESSVYNYQSAGLWDKFKQVKLLAGTTINLEGVVLDELDDYTEVASIEDVITSAFILNLFN